jgi:chromosome segregation ATPase
LNNNFRPKSGKTADAGPQTEKLKTLNTKEQVQRITDKVRQLVSRQETLVEENQQLRTQLENEKQNAGLLREELTLLIAEQQQARAELEKKLPLEESLRSKISALEEKISQLESSPGKMDEATRKSFEKQLNHYIKEIDRCIALLGQ